METVKTENKVKYTYAEYDFESMKTLVSRIYLNITTKEFEPVYKVHISFKRSNSTKLLFSLEHLKPKEINIEKCSEDLEEYIHDFIEEVIVCNSNTGKLIIFDDIEPEDLFIIINQIKVFSKENLAKNKM